jgi:Zn-dependent M32 family carboxypeptidase
LSNNEREDSRSTESWVIGNREFVHNAMARYRKNLQCANNGVNVEDVAVAVNITKERIITSLIVG